MTNDIALQFNSVSYKYDEKLVLENVSFTLKTSEIICIKGRCGCGKTTLSKLACGFLLPTLGDVTIFSQNTKTSDKSFISKIGYVSQNPKMQLVCADVQSDIIFGLENMHLSKKQIRKRADEALAKCKISHLKHKQCHLLSGGEAQLVALSGALAKHPKLLILDELSEMLDEKNKQTVENIIEKELTKGTSILYISHNINFLKKFDNFIDLS